MLGEDLIDVPVETFGGYCPAIVPANLPPGAANIAQDMMFPQAGVRTRGGLGAGVAFAGAAIPADASINGLKTYLTPSGSPRLMIWDSLGDMFKENPQGTLDLINSRPYAGLFYQSQTIFGREYQAFFNALGGYDIPRQYDDTNWDRVSQQGPGAAPVAADENVVQNILASPNGLVALGNFTVVSASEVGYLVTMTLAGAAPGNTKSVFQPGDAWLVAGVGAGYNGTVVIQTVVQNALNLIVTYFSATANLAAVGAGGTVNTPYYVVTNDAGSTILPSQGSSVTIAGAGVGGYDGTWPVRLSIGVVSFFMIAIANQFALAASGAGTWTAVGNVAAGLHQVTVAFVTWQGLITAPAVPPSSWTAAGSKRVQLSQIATGPANVVARLLIFTPVITAPATTGSFYSLPTGSPEIPTSTMLIEDNVTTSLVVDFSDAVLISGFQANYLFNQLELGECAFAIPYNSRLFWLGERARLPNVVNFGFDGGFTAKVAQPVFPFHVLIDHYPLGWTADPNNYTGGTSGPGEGDWADCYAIAGNGNAIAGLITQSAYQDYLGVTRIAANTSYGVRVRLAQLPGNPDATGVININLKSNLGGFATPGLQVLVSTIPIGTFQEFTATLTAPLAAVPTDLLIQVYRATGTALSATVLIDSLEVFPLLTPYNSSTARASYAFNPESYDSITGQVQIRPTDGQQLRAGFPLRNSLYLAKDHYLGYVTDDGVNEPASWAFTEVSATVGICGPNAVDWNEEWAVFAERSGFYICWGSDPVKITPEIQSDATGTGRTSWASINWTAAWTMWVRIDKVNKMILIGAPINGATSPNVVFMVDYRWLDGAEDIAASPFVTYSSFTGKILGHGRGRRWAIWSIAANSMCFAERADGTAQPFFGGVANGKVFWQQDVSIQNSDAGQEIRWQYQSYALPSSMEEQQFQLRAHRKLIGFLKWRAFGSGTMGLGISTAQRSIILRGYTLSANPVGDGERMTNVHAERFFLTAYSTGFGCWAQIEKLIACVKKDSSALLRGMSS